MSVQTEIAELISKTTTAKATAQGVVDPLADTLAALQKTAALVNEPVPGPVLAA